jgi:hypothetical protein
VPPFGFGRPDSDVCWCCRIPAFYDRKTGALHLFYFEGPDGKPVYTCLSQSIAAAVGAYGAWFRLLFHNADAPIRDRVEAPPPSQRMTLAIIR